MNKFKSLKELYAYIALVEGGKSQVIRADIIETVRILSELSFTNPEVLDLLIKNGKRRVGIRKIKKKQLKAE